MHSTDGIYAAMAVMNREVALLGGRSLVGEGGAHDTLRMAWASLVNELALGPAPEYRKCPRCGGTGMRAATRCGTCWEKLVPPPAVDAGRTEVTT